MNKSLEKAAKLSEILNKINPHLALFVSILFSFLIILLNAIVPGDVVYMSLILPCIVSAYYFKLNKAIGITVSLMILSILANLEHSEFNLFLSNIIGATVVNISFVVLISWLRQNNSKLHDIIREKEKVRWELLQKQMELSIREKRYRSMNENAPLGVFRTFLDLKGVFANKAMLDLLRYENINEFIEADISEDIFLDPSQRDDLLNEINQNGKVIGAELDMLKSDGTFFIARCSAWIFKEDKGAEIFIDGLIEDITEWKQAEIERKNLMAQLQEASSQVKTLSGLLPICATCKKIRDEEGNWSEVDQYIDQNSEAELSHGICPTCAEKLYPGALDD